MTARRLVLVGGGHAHLYVLRELARRPVADLDAVLVAPADQYYSAMVPGYFQGRYEAEELRIDLSALASRARVRLVRALAERVDVDGRVVLADGEAIPFDVCSLDVGCDAAGADTPGFVEHAFTLRPMARALELRARLDGLIAAASRPLSIVVVGGGAGGVEVALALRHRLRESTIGGTVSLVERETKLLGEFEPPMRQLATEVLRERGVSLALGGRVSNVSSSAVSLHNGASLPADLVVWVGGAAAPAIVAKSGLARDADGYLLVDRTLRTVDGAPVWGAVECATISDFPRLTKPTDYSVRGDPVLDRSLRAALGRGRPGRYRPQRGYLALLDTGGGWALMRWKGILRHSRWAWRLKDMIDRRFVRRYRVSDEKHGSAS
jgi:selenide,water dikinase